MGLIERINAARRPPAERTWPVGPGVVDLGDKFLGHDDSRFSPEEYGDYVATSNEVYAAANLRARLMSGLDLALYAGRGSEKAEIVDGPAVDLLRRVNPFWTLRRLLRMDELSMSLWGESFWAVERDASGTPVELWWLKSPRVRPVPDVTGYITGFVYEPDVGTQPIVFGAHEIVWFRYPNPIDEFSALSPVAAARLAADTGSAMMKSNRNLFAQGMQMGGVIMPLEGKTTFSQEQAEELREQLDRRFRGVDRAHRWAVLRYEAQFKQMGVTPKDAEFVNGLNLSLRQVANAYGIPSPLLNDLEHATLANAREFQQILWSHTLVPDACLKAAEIAEQLLPMFGGRQRADHAEFDFSKVPALQEAASATWDRERQAIDSGAMTINEWRKSKGMPPVAWGDVWWAPVNKSAVDSADSAPQGDTAPTTMPDAAPDAPAPAPPPADPVAAAEDERAWREVLAAFNGRTL